MNSDNKNELPSALSLTLVGIQFVLIGMLAFAGPLWPPGWSLRVILAVGGMVGILALKVMGIRQMNVFPEVAGQAKLIVLGPYRWIRHPMYTSVLLVSLVWTLGSPLPCPILLWVGLVMTLSVRYEERLLMERNMTPTDVRSSTLSLLCGRAGCVDVRKVCQKDGVSWGITPPFSLSKYFLTYSSPPFYSLACLAHTNVAGVRPGSRATFDRAKVAKTRYALPGHIAEGVCETAEGSPTRCARTRAAGG